MLNKIAFLILMCLTACSNTQTGGSLDGGYGGFSHKINVMIPITETVSVYSSISQPYLYADPRFSIPDYSETSIKVEF